MGLGSNLGDRREHLAAGVLGLSGLGAIVAVSSLYETDPIGGPDQGPYLNAVVVLDTPLGPRELIEACLAIERSRGRERRERWGPRTLDLDVLLHGNTAVDEPGISIPHPRMTERRFVLEPLLEAWPDAALADGSRLATFVGSVASQSVRRLTEERWWEGEGTTAVLETPPPIVSEAMAADVALTLFGIEGVASPLVGERDRNFLLDAGDRRFSLKIANPAQDPVLLEMQQLALEHIATVDPDLGVPRAVRTTSGDLVGAASFDGTALPVRLQTFLEGELLPDGYSTPALRRSMASLLSRLDLALGSYGHPSGRRDDPWDLTQLPSLRRWTHHLAEDRRTVIEAEMGRFERSIIPALTGLRRQMIHSDVNPANLMTAPGESDRLVGIIDFGDLVEGPLVADIAIAAAYQSLGRDDPIEVITDLVGAYHEHLPLTDEEFAVVGGLVRARLVQSHVISAWRASLHPENEYILVHAEPTWEALQRLLDTDESLFGSAP